MRVGISQVGKKCPDQDGAKTKGVRLAEEARGEQNAKARKIDSHMPFHTPDSGGASSSGLGPTARHPARIDDAELSFFDFSMNLQVFRRFFEKSFSVLEETKRVSQSALDVVFSYGRRAGRCLKSI